MSDIEYNLHLEITQPIEIEMDKWLRSMIMQWRSYQLTTIWGRKQKREAEIYINAYQSAIDHLRKELKLFPVSERWKNE